MTSYEVIYKRFLNKVTDYDLQELDDYTLCEMLKEWLNTAVVKVRTKTDLFDKNDEKEVFNNDLTSTDVELVSMGMVLAWVDQHLNSSENVNQFIGGKEEKLRALAHSSLYLETV